MREVEEAEGISEGTIQFMKSMRNEALGVYSRACVTNESIADQDVIADLLPSEIRGSMTKNKNHKKRVALRKRGREKKWARKHSSILET